MVCDVHKSQRYFFDIYFKQNIASQSSILFVAHEWAQKAKALHYNRLKRLHNNKHSCLLDPFISCEEIEVL
jgi:hypothetical protein